MILKINPADVVAIPADYNNTKGRTCRYEVIGEYTEDWRSKLDRGENGFDHDLYSSDGGEYEDDGEDTDSDCDENHCFCDKVDEYGDSVCDHDTDNTQVGSQGRDGCCGGSCHCDSHEENVG